MAVVVMTPDAAGIEAALAAGLAAHPSYRYAAKDEDDEKGERHFIGCNGCQARIMAPTYGAQGEVHRAHVAAALLPVVTQAQARAWDAGYLRAVEPSSDIRDNPYRARADESGAR